MATRPKRMKRISATVVAPGEQSSTSDVQPDLAMNQQSLLSDSMMDNMISLCLAAITPVLKELFISLSKNIKTDHNPIRIIFLWQIHR